MQRTVNHKEKPKEVPNAWLAYYEEMGGFKPTLSDLFIVTDRQPLIPMLEDLQLRKLRTKFLTEKELMGWFI
jgi:hypothetical protein